MRVTRDAAVLICQGYGLPMADGWELSRLSNKLGKVLQLVKSGEHKPSDALAEIVEKLSDSESFEIVDSLDDEEEELNATDEGEEHDDDWDDAGEEDVEEEVAEEHHEEDAKKEDGEDTRDECPFSLKQTVSVDAKDGKWKGVVVEIISVDRVMVEDGDGDPWEEPVENLTIVETKQKENVDADDREIQQLEDQVKALKRKDKDKKANTKTKRGLTRDEMVLKILKESDEGIELEELLPIVEKKYVRQGMRASLVASQSAVDRIVKYGLLFGVVEQKGKMIFWIGTKGE